MVYVPPVMEITSNGNGNNDNKTNYIRASNFYTEVHSHDVMIVLNACDLQ